MVRLESPESIVHVPLSAIENKIIHNWTPNQPTKKVVEEKPKEEKPIETKTDNVMKPTHVLGQNKKALLKEKKLKHRT